MESPSRSGRRPRRTSSAAPSSTTSDRRSRSSSSRASSRSASRGFGSSSAAAVFALWRRPWRAFVRMDRAAKCLVVALGVVFAVMNACFYVAIDALPLGTVAAIEFLPVILLAAVGTRTARNGLALGLAVVGVYLLTDVELEAEPVGVAFAFANAALFADVHRPRSPAVADRCVRADSTGSPPPCSSRRWSSRRSQDGVRYRRFSIPVALAGRHRGRDRVVGRAVRLRPARDGAASASDLRADGLDPPRDGDAHRDRRAPSGAVAAES